MFNAFFWFRATELKEFIVRDFFLDSPVYPLQPGAINCSKQTNHITTIANHFQPTIGTSGTSSHLTTKQNQHLCWSAGGSSRASITLIVPWPRRRWTTQETSAQWAVKWTWTFGMICNIYCAHRTVNINATRRNEWGNQELKLFKHLKIHNFHHRTEGEASGHRQGHRV